MQDFAESKFVPEELIINAEELKKSRTECISYENLHRSIKEKQKTQYSETIDEDFNYAKNIVYNTIEQSTEVLEQLGQIAINNDNPRLFEVYSGLMKNVIDSSKDLMELNKRNKDLKGDEIDSTINTQINNTVMVGSTKELLELLEKG